MNHDYTHCLDCSDNCPDWCFRKRLNDDLKTYRNEHNAHKKPVLWISMKKTGDCPIMEDNYDKKI